MMLLKRLIALFREERVYVTRERADGGLTWVKVPLSKAVEGKR